MLFVYGVHGIAVNDGAADHASSPANFARPVEGTQLADHLLITECNAVLSGFGGSEVNVLFGVVPDRLVAAEFDVFF